MESRSRYLEVEVVGWGGGAEIFDVVVGSLLKGDSRAVTIKKLFNVLRDKDWDCFDESKFCDDSEVVKVVKKIEPDWFNEDDD